jgi:hypothetical protein
VYLGAILLVARVRRLAADPALRRRRGAAAKARARLRRAMAELGGGRLRTSADQIQAALAGLVADWANRPEAGLTARDLCRQLETWELDPSLIQRLRHLLETCEAAQYGAVDAALDQWARQPQELLDALVQALKRGGGPRP